MTLDGAKKISDIVVSWIGVGALIVGALWSLSEYAAHVQDTRVARSLELLKRFNTDMSAPRMRLAMKWENANKDIIALRRELAGASADVVSDRYSKFVVAMLNNEDTLADVTRIMFFTDELVVCVESRICDEAVIRDYMGEFEKTFFNRHYPIICELRNRWNDPSVAEKMQRFFTNTSGSNVCSTK